MYPFVRFQETREGQAEGDMFDGGLARVDLMVPK